MVPEAGVEPVREKISRDFKSRASANSAIPAYLDLCLPHCYTIIAPDTLIVKTFCKNYFFVLTITQKCDNIYERIAPSL